MKLLWKVLSVIFILTIISSAVYGYIYFDEIDKQETQKAEQFCISQGYTNYKWYSDSGSTCWKIENGTYYSIGILNTKYLNGEDKLVIRELPK